MGMLMRMIMRMMMMMRRIINGKDEDENAD